jgi:hypothetical protein
MTLSTGVTVTWATPSTIIQLVPLPTAPPTTVYLSQTSIIKQLPPIITQRVSPRAPQDQDTTVFIDITLEPSDYSQLIPYSTDDLPDTWDPFNPPSTTSTSTVSVDAPFTIGGGIPKTTITKVRTKTVIESYEQPTTIATLVYSM